MDKDEITEALPWADRPVWRSVDTGPGWYEIILDCDRKLREIKPDYRVSQVKEKFGTLRFYPETYPTDEAERERFIAVIREAEVKTETTCEQCGGDGTYRTGGWIRTLCDGCETQRLAAREARS